ncbi:peptidase C65 Otubain [Diplocarpon rosae]|nr:peptidase C65 Otubain [Diplocarpon rosae]
MFQPQPTPYLSSYGADAPLSDFAGFQTSSVGGLDYGGPTVCRDRTFSPVATGPSPLNLNFLHHHDHHQTHHQNHTHTHTHTHTPLTGLPAYHKMSGNDIEAQEAMARDYNPALEGPLVGEKKSSMAIAEEYARADPIYVAKTAALPQNYSHYRPVLGDGNCGWRGKSSMVRTPDCSSRSRSVRPIRTRSSC